MSEGAPGRGPVRLVLSASKFTEVEAETVRRCLTAVRVQARAAAVCRMAVNAEQGQTPGDETRVNGTPFEI